MTRWKWGLSALMMVAVLMLCGFEDDCNPQANSQSQSASGVHQVGVQLQPGADGLTAEQRNIKARLLEDNKPGAIKHLYVISPFSGQVLMYSTVKGKVTSGGKRLTPTTVATWGADAGNEFRNGIAVNLPAGERATNEVLQDDGTYGSSGEYLYWWDVRGAYHQIYLTGGPIISISDQPLPVKSVTINIEAQHE